MAHKTLPNSIRKFIRKEKARIRRENSYLVEVENKIKELVAKIYENNKKTRVKVGL